MSLNVNLLSKLRHMFSTSQRNKPVKIDDIESILDKLQLKEQGLLLALAATDNVEEAKNIKLDLNILHAHQKKGKDIVKQLSEEKPR